MTQEELVEWLKEYRLNLMSLMGQDDYVTGKLDLIKDVLNKCNTDEIFEDIIDIINSENSGLSAEQRLKEIQEIINTKEK